MKEKSAIEIIEEVCGEICDGICKWREDERYQGGNEDLIYTEHCDNCPLNKILG